jgi:hypothetical protein
MNADWLPDDTPLRSLAVYTCVVTMSRSSVEPSAGKKPSCLDVPLIDMR